MSKNKAEIYSVRPFIGNEGVWYDLEIDDDGDLVLLEDYKSVVQQRDALLVELHNLKSAITERILLNEEIKNSGMPPHSDFWHQSIYMADKKVKDALSDTQATDAFTRELMAKGVEMFAELFKDTMNMDVKNNKEFHKGIVWYAARLRKGINDAQ